MYTCNTSAPDLTDGNSLFFNIGACSDFLAAYGVAALQKFGPDGMLDTDMPVLTGSNVTSEQLRVAAVMFWLRELDKAGLPSFIEALAEQLGKGYVLLPLPIDNNAIMSFWRNRAMRFSPQERKGIFDKLFCWEEQGTFQTSIDTTLNEIAQTLNEMAAQPKNTPVHHHISRLLCMTRNVAEIVTKRTAGIVPFAAKEMLNTVRTAQKIMQSPDLLRVLGARSMWDAIRRHAPMVMNREINPDVFVGRAQSGFRILRWISRIAPHFKRIRRDDRFLIDAVNAAQDWLAIGGC